LFRKFRRGGIEVRELALRVDHVNGDGLDVRHLPEYTFADHAESTAVKAAAPFPVM
jgi:hypothetical protein